MNEYDDILNRIVEEFYDTGRLVLNEENNTEEGITYDIEEYVNDLTIPEIEEGSLEFLLTSLEDEDKKSVEVNNIDVIDYLKDNEIIITLKDTKVDTERLLCNSLSGGGIEDYIEQVKGVWENYSGPEEGKNKYLRDRNEMFCQYWNEVLFKCETNQKFFEYCKPTEVIPINEQIDPVVDIESQIEDNINNGEEYSDLRNRRYNLYGALYHFNVANNLITQLLRDEELSDDDIERYLGLSDYLEQRMVIITNLIRRQQNQTNQEGETENVPEDEEEIIDLDSEEGEEDEVVVDDPNEEEVENTGVEGNEDDGDEEETVRIEHNLFDLFKNNVKDKNILYGQWKIKEIEDDSVILKRENVTNSDNLENLLFELGVDDVRVSIEDLKNEIGGQNWEKYEYRYKDTILKNPNEFTSLLNKNIFSSGRKRVANNKTVNDLFEKANLIIDNIILYLYTNGKWKKDSKYIEYHNKLLKLITVYTDRNSSTKELDLYEVVYDLYQLYERLQEKDVLDNKLMRKLFSGNFNKIRDVFNEVRKNNNLDYEKSFERKCNEIQYFEKVTDQSTILDVKQLPEEYQSRSKWNQYLKSKIQSTATTESIIEEFRDMLVNGVDKYDLITKRSVTLTSLNGGESLVIPEGRKVEVKKIKHKNREGEYKDYVMSEFLSLYKNEDPESPEDKIRYGEIINGILSEITSKGGIGNEVIKTMKNPDNGIFGIFYENYIFVPINDIDIRWHNRGHGKGAEDRISLRIEINENPNIYVWKEGNPNCDERFKFDGCEENPGCPQNESTNRLDEIIENFFDTGKFVI